MVRLVSGDNPDVVCLQELPVWAVPRLGEWSGMQVLADVAQPPRLGPLPISAELGGAITALNHGLFRSAVSGQANAILVSPEAGVVAHESLVLNARQFRARQAAWLGLGLVARLGWAKERRVVQVVRARLSRKTYAIANLHATSYPADQRLADAELMRAAVFLDGVAEPGDICVLAGDFNVTAARSATQAELAGDDWGFSPPLGEGIDQVLVRGARVRKLSRWPQKRRRAGGRLLSDHAPVEATLA
jgi:endonuclease/exonuclease/phosphatase family metal-dependent hydrolase